MPSTLNPSCPLCGLRFDNNPLLDLHIREDHRQRLAREPKGDSDPPGRRDPAPTAPVTSKKATTRPAGRGGRADRAKAALRRALRYVTG